MGLVSESRKGEGSRKGKQPLVNVAMVFKHLSLLHAVRQCAPHGRRYSEEISPLVLTVEASEDRLAMPGGSRGLHSDFTVQGMQ